MSTVISFDIGVKNMAFVEALYNRSQDTFKVIRWKVENIYEACPVEDDNDGSTIDEITKHTVNYLFTRFSSLEMSKTTILIERQLPSNYRAFTIAHVIVAHFATRDGSRTYYTSPSCLQAASRQCSRETTKKSKNVIRMDPKVYQPILQ